MSDLKEYEFKDFGVIDFGNTYRGWRWTDRKIDMSWLEFLTSDKCYASNEIKEIARQVILQRKVCPGQLELF